MAPWNGPNEAALQRDGMMVVPCAPPHEVAGVGEGIDEEEERVPETGARVHADEIQTPVLADVIDH